MQINNQTIQQQVIITPPPHPDLLINTAKTLASHPCLLVGVEGVGGGGVGRG